MNQLTTQQAAYVAGVIDGEGHLAIVRYAPREANPSPRFSFVAKVTNTNREWLETLRGWIGGTIYQTGPSPKRMNSRPCFDVRLTGAQAKAMLVQVQPFLMLKQKHALLLMRYFDLAARRREANLPGKRLDPGIVARMETLHAEMKAINLRGLHQQWVQGGPRLHRTCRLEDCERKHFSNGYCKQHYKKFIERGGPAWHERSCALCSRPFVAKRSDAVFCSQRCGDKHRYEQS